MLAQKLRCLGETTPPIPPDCGIISGLVDSYEWAPNQTIVGSVATIHIAGTVYAIVHSLRPSDDRYFITTININAAGEYVNTINWAVPISTEQFQSGCSILKVSQAGHASGDCVIAIWNRRYDVVGDRHDIICRSWRISQAGIVNGEIDNLEMGSGGVGTTWALQGLCRRSSGTNLFIGTAFTGNYANYLFSFEIADNGTFGAVLDEEILDAAFNAIHYSKVIECGGVILASYRYASADKSVFKSYFITDPGGQFTYLHSRDMERTQEGVFMLDMNHMGFNGFIASYRDYDTTVNKVVSHTVDELGNISAPIDTLSIGAGSANGITVASLTGNGIIAAWKDNSDLGHLSTFTMDTNGNFSDFINEYSFFTPPYDSDYIYQWDYPFIINGSSPSKYGLIYAGNANDGWLRTWGVTNICT